MDRARAGTHALTSPDDSTSSFRFEQLFRTPRSEQWAVRALAEDTRPAGRVDVHFDEGVARVTVVMRSDLGEAAAQQVLALVDEQLVPGRARGEVRITLWRGTHEGTFAPD